MSATAGALGSLGSDLSFSVSFNIATELLDAANESHLSEEELIGIVLLLSVVLASMPSAFKSLRELLARQREEEAKVRRMKNSRDGIEAKEDDPPPKRPTEPSGVFEFFTLLVKMAQRISISICVQLLASNVRSRQPLRAVRVVSLLAVAIFFLFLEATSSVGSRGGRA